jgi:ketosteroid isomerase-like protein
VTYRVLEIKHRDEITVNCTDTDRDSALSQQLKFTACRMMWQTLANRFCISPPLGDVMSGFKTFFQIVTLMCLVSSNAFGQDNVDEIREAVTAWERMWNTFDLQEVDRLFLQSDGLSYFSSEREGLIKGIQAVREHHRSFGFVNGGSHPPTKLWLEDVLIKEYGIAAVVTGIWYFQRQDGRLQRGPVSIFYSNQDGNYKIAHMNFSNYDVQQ